jgi:hypothetical protein
VIKTAFVAVALTSAIVGGTIGYTQAEQSKPSSTWENQFEVDRSQDAQITAVMDCLRNNSYSRNLLGQCIDDVFAGQNEVDY